MEKDTAVTDWAKFGLEVREVPDAEAVAFLKANVSREDRRNVFIRSHDYWAGCYAGGELACVIGATAKGKYVATGGLYCLPRYRMGLPALAAITALLGHYDGVRMRSSFRPAAAPFFKKFGFRETARLRNGTVYMERDGRPPAAEGGQDGRNVD